MRLPLASHLIAVSCSFLLLISLGIQAQAQEADGVSTTTYKDWVVRCVDRADLPPCDAVQTAFDTKTEQRVMLTSIAHFGNNDEIGVQIWIPTGLLVSGGVLFEIDQKDQALEALKFTRCEQDGCFIEAIVNEADLAPLRKGNQAAIAVLASNGQPRVVGLSLAGFTKALSDVKAKNTAWFEKNS